MFVPHTCSRCLHFYIEKLTFTTLKNIRMQINDDEEEQELDGEEQSFLLILLLLELSTHHT